MRLVPDVPDGSPAVAADGDRVNTGTSAPSGPGMASLVITIAYVGGADRFANATGQMTRAGTTNLLTRTTVVTNAGRIAYDASDRGSR